MSEKVQRAEITLKPVVYRIAGMDAVSIRRDLVYQATDVAALTMDLYYPSDFKPGASLPAVILVTGYSDIGAEAKVGCKFKEMESLMSWSRLIAASGLVAITYGNREPAADFHALLQYLQPNGAALGIDLARIGLWATSGNSPVALSAVMGDGRETVKCASLLYPFLLDLDGTTIVADASKTFKFVNLCAGKSIDDMPLNVPLLLVRAGREEFPHLNETIDRFVARTLTRNLPITLVNHATGPHAFDLFDDSAASRIVVQQVLDFFRSHLQP
jgi:hypothetical protein